MTFDECVDDIAGRLGLESDEAIERLGRAFNRHNRQISASLNLTDLRRGVVSETTVVDEADITFSGVEKLNFLWHTAGGARVDLVEVTPAQLRSYGEPAAGTPTRWAKKSITSNSVTITLDALPDDEYELYADAITVLPDLSGSDNPTIPQSYQDAVSEAVVAEEYIKQEKTALAASCVRRSEKLISELRLFLAKSSTLLIRQGELLPKTYPTASGTGGAGASGSSVTFLQAGAGAVTRTVTSKLREYISVKDFGARGDGETDDTDAVQAAIDHAESLDNPPPVFFPAGTYELSSITVKRTELHGDGMGRLTFTYTGAGTRLRHTAGATDHLVKFEFDDADAEFRRLLPGVRDMLLEGRREQNIPNAVNITAAASRVSFTVNTTQLGALTLPSADLSAFPFYGFCFFYSAENRYLGHGVVSNIDTGTGAVTLATGWDNYATKTGASDLLTSTEKVVFSGAFASAVYPAEDGRADATMAGYAAIQTADTGSACIHLQNVGFIAWHAAIARGGGLVVQGDNIWTDGCTFGIARRLSNLGGDDYWGRLFLQGNYIPQPTLTAEAGTFDHDEYRTQAAALLYIGARDVFVSATLDHAVNCIVDVGGYQWHFGHLMLDRPYKYGFASLLGSSLSTESIGALQVAAPRTVPSVLNTITGVPRCVFALTGTVQTRKLTVGSVATIKYSDGDAGATFDYLADLASGNRLGIGALNLNSGVDALSADGALQYPTVGQVMHGTDGGLVLARMTQAQMQASSLPVNGWIAFQGDAGPGLRFHFQGAWRSYPTVLAVGTAGYDAPADTSENTLVTVVVPADILGATGILRVTTVWSFTNNANNKTVKVTFGGTDFREVVTQNTSVFQDQVLIANRNASSQIAPGKTTGTQAAYGAPTTGGTTTSAVDTTASVSLAIKAQKASAGDTLKLEFYMVEVLVP